MIENKCVANISVVEKNERGEKGKEDKKIYYALMQVNAAEIMKRQSNGKQAGDTAGMI